MRRIAEENAGGIGERGGNAEIQRTDFAKLPDLARIERVPGDLGAGEMTHQQRDAVILGLHARRQAPRLPPRICRAGSCRCRRGAPRLLASCWAATKASHSASSVMLLMTGRASISETRSLPRVKSIEHVDRRLAVQAAHAARFGNIGDEECLAAGVCELRGDRLEAEAIGVGLDHGRAFDGEDVARQRAPVRLDGGEVDG